MVGGNHSSRTNPHKQELNQPPYEKEQGHGSNPQTSRSEDAVVTAEPAQHPRQYAYSQSVSPVCEQVAAIVLQKIGMQNDQSVCVPDYHLNWYMYELTG